MNKTSEQIQEQIKKGELEIQRIIKNNGYLFYKPIGKEKQFIDLFGSDNYITLLFTAANGVGKTLMAVHMLANLFWPTTPRTTYFNSKLFQNWPYSKQGRIISDPNTIKETIIPMLKSIFPTGRYDSKYETSQGGKTYESIWKTDTGWSFTIMTYEQDPKEFESANLGWFWEDEPPPKAIHDANVARLRNGGVGFITETPLSGSAWLYDEYVTLPDEQRKLQKKAVVVAELEDACIEHGVNGFISHERVMLMISQYDPDEKMARAFGQFQHLAGLVFKKFSRNIHVISPFAITQEDFVVVRLLDPHPRTADAVLWVAIRKDGVKFIIDELSGNFGGTDELSMRIKKTSEPYRIVKSLIDPSALVVDQHTGHSIYGDLKVAGLEFEAASKQRTLGIRYIRDALDYQLIQDKLIKAPTLYVFDTCEVTIHQFEHWQWENWNTKSSQYKDLKEKPVDKDDHMMENLGRLFLSGVEFTSQENNFVYNEVLNRMQVQNLDPYETPQQMSNRVNNSLSTNLDPYEY